jgi:hypothetical protein
MEEIVPPNSAHAGTAKTISAKARANSGLLHFRLIQLIEYAPVKIPLRNFGTSIHDLNFASATRQAFADGALQFFMGVGLKKKTIPNRGTVSPLGFRAGMKRTQQIGWRYSEGGCPKDFTKNRA